jgi:PLP dependent protein
MITQNVKKILSELPQGVELVAATKSRTPEEILKAIEAGIKIIGENYVQEAESKFAAIGNKAKWHLIGHLQSNKAKKAVKIFDCIETVDSADLAKAIDKECAKINKVMEVMIEVNSGCEMQKAGCLPQNVFALAKAIQAFKNIRLIGLMTMGSVEQGEELRNQFKETKRIFEEIKRDTMNLRYLSMGMSSSYKMAIEEGANMVRIGTLLFGARTVK